MQIQHFLKNHQKSALVIVGPTASGKTGLSIKLAKEFNGEIINADSRQIYKYMNIGTAKPTDEEKQEVVHHLLDIVEPDENFSVVDFQERATGCIKDIQTREKLPIIVGGTGLYVESLVYGFTPPSEANPELRAKYQKIAQEEGNQALHDVLKEMDPLGAEKVHVNNTHHLIRALEVTETTGQSKFHKPKKQSPEFDFYLLGIEIEREGLYDRINKRTETMFQKGIVEEVQKLLDMGYTKDLPSMSSIGYREIIEMFEGERNEKDTIALVKQKTRNYAKRQVTWWRRHDDIHWTNLGV